ncbi:unnamed protein product [Urochloa humidicola]
MIAHAAVVLCIVLFSDQLAAASKSFGGGGGGYGAAKSVGQKEPETWAGPLLNPNVVIPKPFIPKPTIGYSTPEGSASYTAGSGTPAQAEKKAVSYDEPPAPAKKKARQMVAVSYDETPPTAKPLPKASNNKGYGSGSGTPSSSSSTPAPAEKKKSAPAAASSSNKGYGGSATPSSSSSTTPAPADKKASPAAASSGNNNAGVSPSPSYGMDPAGEPEYGLNQKAIEDILKEHNAFRAKEHVPALTWNATLAKFSQQYAETLKADCKMVHSTSPYGENLMLGSGAVTWKTTVDEWSDEKKSYHYGSNSCDAGKMCGHYTAVVWKGTTTVGCGRVVCNNGDTMIMCSYWPPGNYDGVKPF